MNKYKVLLFLGLGCLAGAACTGGGSVEYQRYYADGSQLYQAHCANCHMDDGSGLAALIPPLTDTTFLKKVRDRIPCFVSYGLQDSIQVNGNWYQFKMPADKQMPAIDMAKILTYVTNSFGNKQGLYDVKEVQENLAKCR